jgi:CheY-like chemotaxis protein
LYNLVLLEWMIPDLDGLEVCRQARRAGSTVPILMLTARDQVSERVLGPDAVQRGGAAGAHQRRPAALDWPCAAQARR